MATAVPIMLDRPFGVSLYPERLCKVVHMPKGCGEK
jgi:hypothetical protein